MKQPLDKRFAIALGGVVVLGLALRLVYLDLLYDRELFFGLFLDSQHYEIQALRIRAGRGPGDHPYLFSPLYPYFLALFSNAGSELGVRAVQIVQALAGSVTALLAGLIGQRMIGKAAGIVAALLVALHGPFVHQDSMILVASLQTLFVTLALWLAVGARDSWPRWFATGLSLGLAAALRPTLLAVVVTVAVVLVVRGRRWKPAAALLLAVAAVVAPFTARNVTLTGEWVLLSVNGGVNFWVGNHAGSTGLYGLPGGTDFVNDPLSKRQAEGAVGRTLSHREASRWWFDRALGDIREAPISWLRLLGNKSAYFLHPLEISQLGSGFHWYRDQAWPLRWPLDARWMFVFALAALFVGRAFDRESVLWLTCFVLPYSAGICLFFVTGRHRAPIMPAVIVLAAGAAVGLFHAIRSSELRYSRATIAAVVWIAFAGVASHAVFARAGAPFYISEVTGMEDRHRGMALFDAGRFDESVEVYRESLEIREDPLTRTNLANALQAANRLEEAAEEYRRVLQAYPGVGIVWYNYGVLLTSWPESMERAQLAFEEAIRLSPLMPDPHLRLGELHLNGGRYGLAVAELQRCVELSERNDSMRAEAQRLLERARAGE